MPEPIRVLLLTKYDRLGASSRLRFYQYIPYLQTAGIRVTAAPLLSNDYIEALYAGRPKDVPTLATAYLKRLRHIARSRGFDLLWMEGELLPWLPAWIESALSRLGVRYVADYDDAVFHRYDLRRSAMIRALLGRKIDSIMRGAAAVTVGNDYLADRALRAGASRVEYLPTAVDLRRYPARPEVEGASFTIGWIGTPVTARYLHLVQPALAALCREEGTRVRLVGSGPVDIDQVRPEIVPWSEDAEASEIQRFSVGVMPLPAEPWERGKCGYKLIQYMACGRPVVASPVGINRKIVHHGVNGFLAETTDEWVHALGTLRDDPGLRRAMGSAGRALVESEYCTKVTAPRLLEVLMTAGGVEGRGCR